ncbi:MAG: ABC-2 transporter permease [Pseudomonadales bacterium]
MRELLVLIRREWLEHRVMFTFPPAILLALVIVAILAATVMGRHIAVQVDVREDSGPPIPMQQRSSPPSQHYLVAYAPDAGMRPTTLAWPAATANYSPPAAQAVATPVVTDDGASAMLNLVTMPFYFLFLIVAGYACVNMLHDERKDRSILFWKSMPVDDYRVVASKFLFVAWVAPLATLACAVVARLVTSLLLSVLGEGSFVDYTFSLPELLNWLGQLLLGYLFLGLWVSPLYAWTMLAGAVMKKSPMALATVIPLVLIYVEWLATGTNGIASFLKEHLLPATLPSLHSTWSSQLGLVSGMQLWGGVLIALGLLWLTVLARQRFIEA